METLVTHQEVPMRDAITIRRSTEADADDIFRLALLDDRAAPKGESMLAFVDGELRAAVPIAKRNGAVADPFHLTADVVDLLELRAAQEAQDRHRARKVA
jgi:hypothetical protein